MTPTVHVVVPEAIRDPDRPSGGNLYDRRVCAELEALGWTVREHAVPGPWPSPRPDDQSVLAALLGRLPPGAVVLLDGLVASAAPDVVSRYADRLRVAVLVHLPLGAVSDEPRRAEAAMLRQVAAVVTTSSWTCAWLVGEYALEPERVVVAVPGNDLAEPATGTPDGCALLCVGAVTPLKGHDLLVEALAGLEARSWRCTCVGSVQVDPAFVHAVAAQVDAAGLSDRVELTGPLLGAELDAAYRAADVLVLASRAETYGMVVTEALARGLPVIATRVGGVPEALGTAPDGSLPGLLVPAGDRLALADALRSWLDDPGLRARARESALGRRRTLPTWHDAGSRIAAALAGPAGAG